MVDTELDFHERLSILGRKHAAMAQGYVMRMRSDGLMVVHLKAPSQLRLSRLKGMLLLVAGLCVFKALMVMSVGELTYNERVSRLAQGTKFEQSGAWLLQVDPVTARIANVMAPFTR